MILYLSTLLILVKPENKITAVDTSPYFYSTTYAQTSLIKIQLRSKQNRDEPNFCQYNEILERAHRNCPHQDSWWGFSEIVRCQRESLRRILTLLPSGDKNDGVAWSLQCQPTAYPEEWWDRLPHCAFIYERPCRYPRTSPGYKDLFRVASIAFIFWIWSNYRESDDYPVRQEHCEQFTEAFLTMINVRLCQFRIISLLAK